MITNSMDYGRVVKLVYTQDLKSCSRIGIAGSSPASATKISVRPGQGDRPDPALNRSWA